MTARLRLVRPEDVSPEIAEVLLAARATRDELVAKASAVAPETARSYERRWRVWERFCAFHDVADLPADEEVIAAFVLARLEAGVSPSAISSNLSAIRWYHKNVAQPPDPGAVELAKRTLKVESRRAPAAPIPAAVVSLGTIQAMCNLDRPRHGLRTYSARLVRHLSGLAPRQLEGIRVEDVTRTPVGVNISVPAYRSAGRAATSEATVVSFERFEMKRFCPVEAVEVLIENATGGRLFKPKLANLGGSVGWEPVGDRSGLAWAIHARNRAIVAVGYHGALRAAEMVNARLEDLEWLGDRSRFILTIPSSKTAQHDAQYVPLAATGDASCPVTALFDWFNYRGDDDGPLFSQIHHGETDARGITAGELRSVLADMANEVGVKVPVTPHSLRRSWATHAALRLGDVGFDQIMGRLRHERPDTTATYIENLALHTLDPSSFLSPSAIEAAAGTTRRRPTAEFAATALAVLVEAVRQSAAVHDRAPTTTVTYAGQWAAWELWATENGLRPLPAHPDHVALFLASRHEAGASVSTIAGFVSAIRAMHHDLSGDAGGDAAADVAEGVRRSNRRRSTPAPALTVDQVRLLAATAMADWFGAGAWADLRDVIMVVVGYAGAFRGNDLVRLRGENIEIRDGYAVARLAMSKQNPKGERLEQVRLDDTSGMAQIEGLMTQWRTLNPEGGPLLAVEPGEDQAISIDTVRNRLRRLAEKVGMDVAPGAHSLRRSWATTAYEHGAALGDISRHLRHVDPTITPLYLERTDPWRNSPSSGDGP